MAQSHFTGRRHYEGEASGPFSFLNPTVRKRPLQLNNSKSSQQNVEVGKSGSDGQEGQSATSSREAETRADEVQEKWRSRDNRKGA